MNRLSRSLLTLAAIILAFGACVHASAFGQILFAVAASNLTPFAANSLKVLWLGDSATCAVLAILFGFIAARPAAATNFVIVLLALIPAMTAVLIYHFIGSFIGGHILLAAAVAAIAGALTRTS